MKTNLEWPDLWNVLAMQKDKAVRWLPSKDTPDIVKKYLSGYRVPSRRWPNSYATPLLTKKFASVVTAEAPALAKKLGLVD